MSERQRILVVDDVPTNILFIAEALGEGYEVVFATCAKEAIESAMETVPDLILLDVMMPDVDGYEVCIQLKADPRFEMVPIIFLTALGDHENEAKGLELGAIDYITKPANPALLRARVRNHLHIKQAQDQLKSISMTDGLTGLANRRRFDEQFDLEWRRAQRSKHPLSIILGDIDFFKNYNDGYGHIQGDECLKQVAGCFMHSSRRPTDLATRFGGEEFVCLLSETDEKGALDVGEKLLSEVRSMAIPHSNSLIAPIVTISLGIATAYPHKLDSASVDGVLELLQKADRMLYKAKNEGRNRLCAWCQ
ncbi:MAG: diguanylate cyclase [Holophagaceae bacterium]|jgi:diguanylate cyclase (GGDEF)-like protein|nr:diguanylate cyclase [Holophagaceae bacterium]